MSKDDPERAERGKDNQRQVRNQEDFRKLQGHKRQTGEHLLMHTRWGGFKCPGALEAAVKCVKPGLSQTWAGGGDGVLKPGWRPRLNEGLEGNNTPVLGFAAGVK